MIEIKIKGALTPRFINSRLGPFLETLANLQHTIDEIKQVHPSKVKVLAIEGRAIQGDETDSGFYSLPLLQTSWKDALEALEEVRESIETLGEEPESDALIKALREAIVKKDIPASVLDSLLFEYMNRAAKTRVEMPLRAQMGSIALHEANVEADEEDRHVFPVVDLSKRRRGQK